MKKRVSLLFMLLSLTSIMFVRAQGLTAVLQKGEDMTVYYGVDAFKEALVAAGAGDVITLSTGTFTTGTMDEPLGISQSVSIIGNGGIDSYNSTTTLNYLQISANDVKMEGIKSTKVELGKEVRGMTFFRSYTDSIHAEGIHFNTLIDQCRIDVDQSVRTGDNYCIRNSVVNILSSGNSSSNKVYIENCIIFDFTGSYGPTAIYKNNVILANSYRVLNNPSQAYFNVFKSGSGNELDVNIGNKYSQNSIFIGGNLSFTNPMSSFKVKDEFKGQDSTPVGIYGGTGFSSAPSNPQIVSKTIDSHTDKDGNINVKITVKAQP